ncbi:MAG TPA: hypothetical protein ENG50_02590 [Candidatus Altiarchaeales archaeon]|nr:hypothetical protein [Candidatus Altiarchaeales archaeon]
MPHKCARCGKIYEDNADELINGCTCGSRVFIYLRESPNKSKEEIIKALEETNIDEEDLDWIEEAFGDKLLEKKETISFDVENLVQIDKGKYRLDLPSLMRGDPIVLRTKKGVYYIDIAYAMRKRKK